MGWLVTKYLITAAVVVVVSEAAKRSDKLGGAIAALPLVTLLALLWLYVEKQPQAKIANHAFYTFWYVLPTVPWLLARVGFWPAMLASAVITAACFSVTALAVRPLGIQLLP